ncbi:hypothetical protein HPP92_023375 [Vanilla planifolia]|uniref:Uncharacterized protein n=1 Tax=Vanilla planifolia TaxID=51239 RepID=A0A835PZC0_VANPL|nr:hypothetical protein HPP92_023375 [Vanilla planifolia]
MVQFQEKEALCEKEASRVLGGKAKCKRRKWKKEALVRSLRSLRDHLLKSKTHYWLRT